jgi:hypothetical protein
MLIYVLQCIFPLIDIFNGRNPAKKVVMMDHRYQTILLQLEKITLETLQSRRKAMKLPQTKDTDILLKT